MAYLFRPVADLNSETGVSPSHQRSLERLSGRHWHPMRQANPFKQFQLNILQVQMTQINGETMHDNEELVRTFVLAAFEKRQLAEQIDTLYESVDTLGATLDIESKQKLFENTSDHMKRIAARLTEIEQQLNEMLPDFLAASQSLENVASASPLSDSTLSFEIPKGEIPKGMKPLAKTTAPGLPRPLSLPKLEPDKPTLIATEPAPLLNDNDDKYQFEDDEDYDLANESVFDPPLNPLPDTATESVDSLDASAPHSDTPDNPEHTDTSPATDTNQTDESWHSAPAEVVFDPKATMRYGADAIGRRTDFTGNDEVTKVAKLNLIQKRHDTATYATAWESEDSPPVDDQTESVAQAAQMTPPMADEPPTDLANLLEPEDETSPVETDDSADASDTDLSFQNGTNRDENILFWKQSPGSEDPLNTALHASQSIQPSPENTKPDPIEMTVANREHQFVLSRIPSLFPGGTMSSLEQFSGIDDALDHIQSLEDTEEDADEGVVETEMAIDEDTSNDVATDADSALGSAAYGIDVEVALAKPDDETATDVRLDDDSDDSHSVIDNSDDDSNDTDEVAQMENAFESELYEMLDLHAPASTSLAPNIEKQTLIGLGQTTVDTGETGYLDASVDTHNTQFDPETNKDSQQG
ncbi:MAG: hypothetical protein JXX14_19520 [Deltaproteobacteria bacterium]|nr:hypothetical protein [Deltaproteobacteria bacterium]